MTMEELEKKHEEECPNWKLLQGLTNATCTSVNDSLHALVISIISIILSAISIILRFV